MNDFFLGCRKCSSSHIRDIGIITNSSTSSGNEC